MSGTNRIKLKNKNYNKLKTAVERVVVSHGGDFEDANIVGGRVKSTYERVIDTDTLRFRYTWHGSLSDWRAIKNSRSQINAHLQRLKIKERLPSFKLREGASKEDALMNFRKRSKQGRAFLALYKALDALDALFCRLRYWKYQYLDFID